MKFLNISNYKSKRFLLPIILALLTISLAGLLYILNNSRDNTKDSNIEEAKSLSTYINVEGNVELFLNDEWVLIEGASTELSDNFKIKTSDMSNANIELNDGSFLRLDSNTEIELINQFQDEYRFRHIKGNSYARVKDDKTRSFIIETIDNQFKALGTSFMVSNDGTNEKLFVFQSSVEVLQKESLETLIIDEGNSFDPSNSTLVQFNQTDLSEDTLNFIQWNEVKDIDAGFDDQLGVLSIITSSAIAEANTPTVEEVGNNNVEISASPLVEPTPSPAPNPTPSPAPNPTPITNYPTGPEPLFPSYYQSAYQEYGEWMSQSPYLFACAASIYDINLTNGTTMELWWCGTKINGRELAVQYVPGRGGISTSASVEIIPVLLPNGVSIIAGEYSKYNNQFYNSPFVGPNTGNIIRFAQDHHIDSLISAGIL